MSKVKSYTTLVILILLGQGSLLLAQETPVSTGGAGASSSSGTYTGLVETTYDDTNWVLVISDLILRENLCDSPWYEKVFNPCYGTSYNRYWKLESCAEAGRAFPMSVLKPPGYPYYSLDSLYVRQGFEFQLYYKTRDSHLFSKIQNHNPRQHKKFRQ